MFYYLLMGASKEEREEFHLLRPQDYLYLKQVPLIHTPYGNSHAERERPTRHIVGCINGGGGCGVFRRIKSASFSYVSHMFMIIISLNFKQPGVVLNFNIVKCGS